MDGVDSCEFRVRYAETDQMGVAHHAHYVIWCEHARTEYMRNRGVSYRSLEQGGLLLPVIAVKIRYRAPARYEDLIRVRCWVREASRRHVEFGYAVEHAQNSSLLATAATTLMAVDVQRTRAVIPDSIRDKLVPVEDPVHI
jgi:acyl-CoA thioester hydrolase